MGAAAFAPASTGATSQTSRDTLRILIVDDHEAVRVMFSGVLQHYAARSVVGVASDGLDAIAQAHALRPERFSRTKSR
jgi:PleD family two-component response regulator